MKNFKHAVLGAVVGTIIGFSLKTEPLFHGAIKKGQYSVNIDFERLSSLPSYAAQASLMLAYGDAYLRVSQALEEGRISHGEAQDFHRAMLDNLAKISGLEGEDLAELMARSAALASLARKAGIDDVSTLEQAEVLLSAVEKEEVYHAVYEEVLQMLEPQKSRLTFRRK